MLLLRLILRVKWKNQWSSCAMLALAVALLVALGKVPTHLLLHLHGLVVRTSAVKIVENGPVIHVCLVIMATVCV